MLFQCIDLHKLHGADASSSEKDASYKPFSRSDEHFDHRDRKKFCEFNDLFAILHTAAYTRALDVCSLAALPVSSQCYHTPRSMALATCFLTSLLLAKSSPGEMSTEQRRNAHLGGGGEGKSPRNEKTRRMAASSGTILTCEHPGATPPGIEQCLPRWEESSLTTTQPRPLGKVLPTCACVDSAGISTPLRVAPLNPSNMPFSRSRHQRRLALPPSLATLLPSSCPYRSAVVGPSCTGPQQPGLASRTRRSSQLTINPLTRSANRVRFPAGSPTGFSHVGIVPDDAAARRVFSGISRSPLPFNSAAAPYSPLFTLIGSRDLDIKAHFRFIRHALDYSEPIADLQGNKLRVPYCQECSNTGYSLEQQPMNQQLRLECTQHCGESVREPHTYSIGVTSLRLASQVGKCLLTDICRQYAEGYGWDARLPTGKFIGRDLQNSPDTIPSNTPNNLETIQDTGQGNIGARQLQRSLIRQHSQTLQLTSNRSHRENEYIENTEYERGTQRRGKVPGNTRRPEALSCTILTCENPGVTRLEIEPVQDKIDSQHVYTEVTFAIESQFIRHALDNSKPIAEIGKIREFNDLYARLHSFVYNNADKYTHWLVAVTAEGDVVPNNLRYSHIEPPNSNFVFLREYDTALPNVPITAVRAGGQLPYRNATLCGLRVSTSNPPPHLTSPALPLVRPTPFPLPRSTGNKNKSYDAAAVKRRLPSSAGYRQASLVAAIHSTPKSSIRLVSPLSGPRDFKLQYT
ncbi:hypothetical protein PR048_022777 [Dryococelus australis]|uniref:Uncharacterized protein n=1 Tax=Dryococelus australis TaxID=614101 RepID=A0ABQ9GS88_9NEOP|nr:hypothetical protein PR048_022777 [Dryococelus australis]